MGWQAVGLAATLFVRSFNNFGVPEGELTAARRGAAALLSQAGVNVVWADCWVRDHQPAGAPARCQAPVGGDIVLRLHKAGADDRSRFVSMGFSLVGAADSLPFLSTVYVDRVYSVAHRAGVEAHRVLGLAIAHEIGHVLINSNKHASSGLMRADWPRHQLRITDSAEWQFLDTDAAKVRVAALERLSVK